MSKNTKIKEYLIKAIFFDLDGTLLNDKKIFLNSSIKTLKSLRQKNIKTFIVTGRSHLAIKELIFKNSFEKIAVCSNGSIIYDFENKKVLNEVFFEKKFIKKIFFLLSKANITFLIYGYKNNYYFNEEQKKYKWINDILIQNNFKKNKFIIPFKKIDFNFIYEIDNEKIYKILIIDNLFFEKAKYFINKSNFKNLNNGQFLWKIFDNKIQIVKSQKNILDFNPLNVSKGLGINIILNHYNLSFKNTAAFGDADNDISMMKNVNLSIAMKNGTNNLKKHAKYITDSNNENGIYKFLKQKKVI